jgi:secreted trypsin-like serine protease
MHFTISIVVVAVVATTILLQVITAKLTTSPKVQIANGQAAQLGWFPYMAGLKKTNSQFMFCGGSLISDRHVLTAAHCFARGIVTPSSKDNRMKAVPNLEVILGRIDISTQDGISVGVDDIYIHPSFNSTSYENDIAVVKLSNRVQFTNNIIPLNLINGDFSVGTVVTVTGFGYVDQQERLMPKILQYINVPIVNGAYCLNKNKYFNQYVQLCVGSGNGQDACTGDSGGPAAVFDSSKKAWFQTGIVSFGGVPCGGQGVIGTYAKVSVYVNWIKQQMAR